MLKQRALRNLIPVRYSGERGGLDIRSAIRQFDDRIHCGLTSRKRSPDSVTTVSVRVCLLQDVAPLPPFFCASRTSVQCVNHHGTQHRFTSELTIRCRHPLTILRINRVIIRGPAGEHRENGKQASFSSRTGSQYRTSIVAIGSRGGSRSDDTPGKCRSAEPCLHWQHVGLLSGCVLAKRGRETSIRSQRS